MLSLFETYHDRLNYLEKWYEIGIRPPKHVCNPCDYDLLELEHDDIKQLFDRCIIARQIMNENLPPHEHALDDYLCVKPSMIPDAGLGLFYEPYLNEKDRNKQLIDLTIKPGAIVCYYTGYRHNYHSSKMLKDRSYLLCVGGDCLVDPLPLVNVKARYINDPMDEDLCNVKFVAQVNEYRCAVVATREIRVGEELLVSYGDHYWSQQKIRGKSLRLISTQYSDMSFNNVIVI